jgi:hypothetical protein
VYPSLTMPPESGSCGQLIALLADPEWTTRFHVRRMDWDENRIVIAAGVALHESELDQAANPNDRRTHHAEPGNRCEYQRRDVLNLTELPDGSMSTVGSFARCIAL